MAERGSVPCPFPTWLLPVALALPAGHQGQELGGNGGRRQAGRLTTPQRTQCVVEGPRPPDVGDQAIAAVRAPTGPVTPA